MNMKVTRLTPLLHELEAVMTALGAPFAAHARPGLGDDEIDALLEPTGLVAPTELREWWRWHHGAATSVLAPIDGHEIGPGVWGLMSIPEAIQDRAEWLEDAVDLDWQPTWLPFAFAEPDHQRLVARIEDSTADEVCIGAWWVFDVPPEGPVAGSLVEVVETWLCDLREGHVVWNGVGWVATAFRPDLPPYAAL